MPIFRIKTIIMKKLAATTGASAKARFLPLQFEQIKIENLKFNREFYSEGIEQTVMGCWKRGRRDEAFRASCNGLDQVDEKAGRRVNFRLYDLVAGLLIVDGRTDALRDLAARLDRMKMRSGIDKAR